MLDGSLKLNAASEIAEENNIKLAKVAWLSAKHNKRVFSSLVAYFIRDFKATCFLRERYIYVDKELVNIRTFKPKEGLPRYFNRHGLSHKAFNY